MKISKNDLSKLINKHRSFDAFTVSVLNDKKSIMKLIESSLDGNTTIEIAKN